MSNPVPLVWGRSYHVFNRGNNHEDIFIQPRNYRHFLSLYAHHIVPVADTYAYCLLKNHFHLLVRIKDEPDLTGLENLSGLEPSRYFANFFNAYTKAINKAYRRTGALFQRPFGRIEVTSEAYFVRLVTYIHQNPQRHNFVDDFRDWPYSSYHALCSTLPTRLARAEVLGWFAGLEDFEAAHEEWIGPQQISALAPDDFD